MTHITNGGRGGKFGTVIPYLKKIQKSMNHVIHTLHPADIGFLSMEINNFSHIKKYRHRLHFNT